MNSEELFKKRLTRLNRWVDRVARTWQKAMSEVESQYLNLLRDLEEDKNLQQSQFKVQEEQLKGQLDQAGKDFVKSKYLFEKDSAQRKDAILKAQREIETSKQQISAELSRVNQEKTTLQISFERQKNALNELYNEKKRNLLVTREKLVRESTQSQSTYKSYKEKYDKEFESLKKEYEKKISFLKDQLSSKQQGWNTAAETMKRDLEAITQQRDDIERKLSSIQSDKEREFHDLHMQMEVAREQLDLDKVSLVEKAEEDQRRTEAEVQSLQEQIGSAEKSLQSLILQKETEKKTAEEGFHEDETRLKEALINESEKRDFEQKLYTQERSIKERELHQLKDEFEKKKSQWDNQVKTLMMQKSLQEAEANAERMHVEREARVVVRSLEAKRDELKQRLTDLESRHGDFGLNSSKEMELLKQRWQWRKDRLWSLWQGRLDLLKKERTVLLEQLEQLQTSFSTEKKSVTEDSSRYESQVEELRENLAKGEVARAAERRQREIQLELEKTRIIAQIKECETLVIDWMDKQKLAHQEFAKQKGSLVEDLGFVDRYYRSQQDETELFLSAFQRALSLFKGQLEQFGIKQDAA